MANALYGQELYDQLNLQLYALNPYKVGQLVSNGIEWGLIEGFLTDRRAEPRLVVRLPLPDGYAYEAWKSRDITETEDRATAQLENK